jgi:hypothetical protein
LPGSAKESHCRRREKLFLHNLTSRLKRNFEAKIAEALNKRGLTSAGTPRQDEEVVAFAHQVSRSGLTLCATPCFDDLQADAQSCG